MAAKTSKRKKAAGKKAADKMTVSEKPLSNKPVSQGLADRKIYFVTGNINKLEEIKKILSDFDLEQIDLDLPELQGEPEDIAMEKARIACERTGKTVFVDDTCLVFEAWNGLPGPYVKHFLDKLGVPGLYKMLEPYDNKRAYAQATIGYCAPGKEPLAFIGRVDGSIVPPAGESGFRFDKIFKPDGHDRRFSEMTMEEKNEISHRRRSAEAFKEWLEGNRKDND
ncbi:RdgB/HAM1 family non-canonical purine NTP pyrophosphatase [Candidatus Woesearchaeota archaeon]|nr:RdgB/HAM1 family non-canonical purine NTP pyrophosphatase [Candidatus Woesearchaeota archaeon]